MFSVQKVQNFPTARAKSDGKGKLLIFTWRRKNLHKLPFFYTTFRRKKNTVPELYFKNSGPLSQVWVAPYESD